MKLHSLYIALFAATALGLSACGQPKPAASNAPESAETPANPSSEAPVATAPALPRTPAPAGASVSILSPRNGDEVTSPVKVVFDIQGMVLAPAGDPTPDSGHHHLLIDTPLPDLSQPIPADDQHIHFGKAQTEAEVTLTPGTHTLQLLLGDTHHVPHNPPVMSTPITITVK
ncbi:MAG: DUF4399 domain-containing protein [Gammaproteobacteria bacterium]